MISKLASNQEQKKQELKDLLHEFDCAYKALIERVMNSELAACPECSGIIVNIVPRLAMHDWDKLSDALNKLGWTSFAMDFACALELNNFLHSVSPLFLHKLSEEGERARRHGSDLALIIIGGVEPLTDDMFEMLQSAARLELAGGDAMAKFGENKIIIVSPTAKQMRARSLSERILDRYNAAVAVQIGEPMLCKAGISNFSANPAQTTTKALNIALEQVVQVFEEAQMNQAKVYQTDKRPVSERSVLVETNEKSFLFFGSTE